MKANSASPTAQTVPTHGPQLETGRESGCHWQRGRVSKESGPIRVMCVCVSERHHIAPALMFCSCRCIEVYQAPSLKLLCSIQQHHKIINVLRWHHEHSSPPQLHGLLASGSSNAIVYVHDLRAIVGEGDVFLSGSPERNTSATL